MTDLMKRPRRDVIRDPSGAILGFKTPIPVSTTFDMPGMRIVEVLGIARGNTIRARHVGRDILAAFRNLIGGEITDYTKMLSEAREQALDRMIESALAMGADGVIGVRFETCSMMQGAAELLVYGTAVKLDRGPSDQG